MLSKLYELSQSTHYPKLVYNVKIACLRSRWIIWENSELQVGVVYEKRPRELVVEMHLGNKSRRELLKFTVKFEDQAEPIFNK